MQLSIMTPNHQHFCSFGLKTSWTWSVVDSVQNVKGQSYCLWYWSWEISPMICDHGWNLGSPLSAFRLVNGENSGNIMDLQLPIKLSQWCVKGRWWLQFLRYKVSATGGLSGKSQTVTGAYYADLMRKSRKTEVKSWHQGCPSTKTMFQLTNLW